MKTITFECEVITPMFLAGADGQTPELRAPSIKGAMRFWWRAVNGHLSLAELKRQEAEIFGNQEKRSKVEMVVEWNESNLIIGKARPLPHSERKTFKIQALMPKSKFNVVLTSKDKETLEAAKNTFILLSFLGGLGKRSRRGFGSFRILKIDGHNFYYSFSSLKKYLRGYFDFEVEQKIVFNSPKIIKPQYPFIKEVLFVKHHTSYNNLLYAIGEATHKLSYSYRWYYEATVAGKSKRFASTVIFSIVKAADGYELIATKLNVVSPYPNENIRLNLQQELIEKTKQ